MTLDKVIARAVLSTLIAIFALFTFMFTSLCLVYPSTMMQITKNMGMNDACIKYARRAYDRTGDIYYIATATHTAIASKDYKKIVVCGNALVVDDEFQLFCEEKDKEMSAEKKDYSYEQQVYGIICVSEYTLGKKAEAVARAFESLNGGFPRLNAVVALLFSIEDDETTKAEIKGKIEQMNVENLSEKDRKYFDEIFALIG